MPTVDVQAEIVKQLARCSKDPLKFVKFAFPWGTGALENKKVEKWQEDFLCSLKGLTADKALQLAVASGHGIGKSCLVSWLILWGLYTYPDAKIVVTANTETQLKTKTWAELAKWYEMFFLKNLFTLTATAIYSADPAHEKTWRADMIPWSENKTESFAGMHNEGKRIVLIFDEASAIPDKIWEVSEGALTDKNTEIIWAVFGNPTRNTGRFRECFAKYRHRWQPKQIDSREVEITNKEQIARWVQDYGEDSDFVKVRVRGQFPTASDRQFIGTTVIEDARKRFDLMQSGSYYFAPRIIGVDPAWTGGDETVVWLRQGNYCQRLAVYPKNDNDFILAGYIAEFEDKFRASAVFIDQGYGTGLYSAGQQLGRKWMLVAFGGKSGKSGVQGYKNKRAEMWGEMKDWLVKSGGLPPDQQLLDDLMGPEYQVTANGELQLESKESMKARGIASPNRADALALTFAAPVRQTTREERSAEPAAPTSHFRR